MEIDPRYPRVTKLQRDALLEVKQALEAQAPEGAAPDPFEHEQEQRDEEAGAEPGPPGRDDGDG